MTSENETVATAAEVSNPMTGVDRALMAEERTCSAWIRTGLASMATGLAIAKIMPNAEPRWAVACLGMTMVFVALLSFAVGFAGYARGTRHCRDSARSSLPWWVLMIFCNLLAVAVVLTASFIMQGQPIP